MGILAMWMRFLFFFSTVLLSVSCSKHVETMPPETPKVSQTRSFSSFNKVDVEGPINVSLHTGYRHPQVILHGEPSDLLQVRTVLNNNTLMISVGKGYPHFGPITVEIRSRFLNGFTYRGAGIVNGKNLHSSLMDISINNSGQTTLGGQIAVRKLEVSGGGYTQISGITGQCLQLSVADSSKVQLAGMINITHLDLDEKAWVGMYWIKSNALIIRGRGQSFLQLGGIVGKLDVELWDQAHFSGRYLRANRAFVKTHNKSVADISAINHQHTLATDASDIYFYNIPTMKTDFMAYNGSVLDMRDWNPWDRSVYTRYNKP